MPKGISVLNFSALIVVEVFNSFDLKNTNISIKISNRKIISWFISSLWLAEKLEGISNLIDKRAKITNEKFKSGLSELWISDLLVDDIIKFLDYKVTFENLLTIPDKLWIRDKEFLAWINELYKVLGYLFKMWAPKKSIDIDFSIIRWLAYYTGTVFETFIEWDEKLWSIWSWWRYDNLTSFIDPKTNFSWVWFSIWVTRMQEYIFDNINKSSLPKTTTEYMVINFSETFDKSMDLYNSILKSWKKAEFYPEPDKLAKQFKYSDKKWIKFCIIMWESEIEKWIYSVKNMQTGEIEEKKL